MTKQEAQELCDGMKTTGNDQRDTALKRIPGRLG
jgi:hypothetical protein